MVTGNIVPDIETFNILLDAICKQGTIDKAHEVLKAKDVFDSLATEGFAPDLTACKMLINGYAKCKSKGETVKLAE
ncbi:hypothetical protein V6N11_033500 [Hibiscus sabdariffa]|uniref:Pentatricopeptide repeat-containing protein n=1 Tax=Hibiscus sabdariffa TaxID=183260 RepID=A0ABR2PYA0_9ROSI